MQKIKLPPWFKVPGVLWIVGLIGIAWWVHANVADPQLVYLTIMGIGVVVRTLVNNDAALEQAAGAGQAVLDYLMRKDRAAQAESMPITPGMRSASPAIEPLPSVEIPDKPNKVASWLLG